MPGSELHGPQTASESGFRLGQRPALDGLRGCAILAVLLHHTNLVQGGFFGVDVFFVLSGFLITVLLLQEWGATGSVSLPRFYLRRALRLLPALCGFLLVSWLFAWLVCGPADEQLTRHGSVAVLLYYFNWEATFRPRPYTLLVHTWSLSVEEQFYLVWPVVLVCLLRWRVRRCWIAGLVLAGIAAVSLERRWLLRHGMPPNRFYFATDMRLDVLLIGCLLGLLASWELLPRKERPRTALRVAGLLAAAALVWHVGYCELGLYALLGGFLVVAVCTATLLAALLCQPPRLLGWLLERPLLAWIGRVSYGLYLWHVLVFWHLIPRFQTCLVGWGVLRAPSTLLQVLLEFPAALAVAALSYYLIERPFLSLKRRLERRPVRTVETGAAAPALAA